MSSPSESTTIASRRTSSVLTAACSSSLSEMYSALYSAVVSPSRRLPNGPFEQLDVVGEALEDVHAAVEVDDLGQVLRSKPPREPDRRFLGPSSSLRPCWCWCPSGAPGR